MNKFSLSQRLFFRINAWPGRWKWLGLCMIFCACVLIFFVVGGSIVFTFFILPRADWYDWLGMTLIGFTAAIGTNYLLAYFLPQARPIIEFPLVKQLFNPLKTWKSFPSDHATTAFFFVTICARAGVVGIPLSVLLAMAIVISAARVYAGVHYPRDIVGGIVIGGGFAFFAPWLYRVFIELISWIL